MQISEPAFFRGVWAQPGHPEYEVARWAYNQRVDARPGVIARCAGVADVVAAIGRARGLGLALRVRSAGYTFVDRAADGEMVIDLSPMRAVQILPERRIARIQGGVRTGDLQCEAAVHGLGGVTGVLSGSGVGLMLGGGIGALSPRAGYASDNILAVELVTATGEVVAASPEEDPDLFWAVRGSTGNFGVVTALDVRLHDVPRVVWGGAMSWSADDLAAGIEALRTSLDWASDNLSLIGVLSSASLAGGPGLDVVVCHSGSGEQARAELDRLRSFGPPNADTVTEVSFRDLHFRHDDLFPPMRTTLDDQPVSVLGDELVAALVAAVSRPAGEAAHIVEIVPHAGALGRRPAFAGALHEAAYGPIWNVSPGGYWQSESEDSVHDQWVQDVLAAVRRIGPTVDGRHPNAVGVALDAAGVERMYGGAFARLRELKLRWDPDNMFPGVHTIPSAEPAGA